MESLAPPNPDLVFIYCDFSEAPAGRKQAITFRAMLEYAGSQSASAESFQPHYKTHARHDSPADNPAICPDTAPDAAPEIRPSLGIVDMAKEYVQDTFLLEIIHALGRREPGRRVRTRESILKNKKLIVPETLRKVSESVKDSLGDDALGRHSLAALDDKSPPPGIHPPSGNRCWFGSNRCARWPTTRRRKTRTVCGSVCG